MSYRQALQYLETFVNYEKLSSYPYGQALNLERFQGFLDSINHPERKLKCIHIAGTKGKGSTSAFIAYILREAGFKAGLYTSPHLADFRERIRILSPSSLPVRQVGKPHAPSCDFEGMIPKLKLASLVNRLKPAIEKYNRSSKYGPLTFFEACTALAFLYFREKKVDFAVLETGLGGSLDATNVVHPLVSVITPVSYEHMDKLGRTLEKIATEKAGIIKSQNSIVISAPQKKEALLVIRKKCIKEGAKLLIVGKEVTFRGKEDNFSVNTPGGKYAGLKIKLIGAHQVMNAASSLAAVSSLAKTGAKVGVDSIRKGLYNTSWPGRCEVVAKEPWVVLDGAQNKASAAALKEAVKEKFRYRRLILILGVSDDKDIRGIAGELAGQADIVILTKSRNPRAANPATFARYFGKKEKYITANTQEAKILAKKMSRKEDLILVTGSLFVVGEFRND